MREARQRPHGVRAGQAARGEALRGAAEAGENSRTDKNDAGKASAGAETSFGTNSGSIRGPIPEDRVENGIRNDEELAREPKKTQKLNSLQRGLFRAGAHVS